MRKSTTMTDATVLNVIMAAKRARRAAETNAQRKLHCEKQRINSFFGDSDVERAARDCAIRRAETSYDVAIDRARALYTQKIERLRIAAGEWSDLVPAV